MRHLKAVPSGGRVQVPLVDHETEREVLASVLFAEPEQARSLLACVRAEDWDLERHRHVFEAMVSLADRGVLIEAETLRHALIDSGNWERIGGARGIGELLDRQGLCANAEHYAKRVRRLSLQRQLAAEWQSGVADVIEGADRSARTMRVSELEADLAGLDNPPETGRQLVDRLFERIREPQTRNVLSTGLPDLDEKLDGGLGAGWLVVVLGAPKQGKTAFAMNNLARHALCLGHSVLYVGEMADDEGKMELMHRLLAAETGIPVRAQKRGDLTPHQWSIATGASDAMALWSLGVSRIGPVAKIRNDAQAFKKRVGGLGLIVVDYVQLVNNGMENRVLDIEHTTRALKELAGDLGCPIVLVSQPTNDAAKSKTELGLFDGKGSGSIAADCDLCLVPVREESSDRAGIVAPGFRHGESFRIPLGSWRFNGARMRFEQ